MSSPTLSIVVAMDEKRGIGKNNEIPWHIPGDLPRFKALTMGHPVIMGRKTFESIIDRLGKPLSGRTNIVITRNPGTSIEFRSGNGIISYSIDEAIQRAKNLDQEEIFIIGGGQIFNQSLDIADKLYLTIIKDDYHCDTFFPEIDKRIWKEITNEPHENFSYITYLRADKSPQ